MNVYEVGADLAYGQLTYARTPRQHANDEKQLVEWDKQYSEWKRLCEETGWVPPRLESPRGKAKTLPVDCVAAALGSGRDMLLNERAREALAPLLSPHGEYLPVQVDGLDYRIFSCTTLVDIADQDRIEGKRSPETYLPPGWWDSITRWSFHPERVATAPAVFTVPQRRWTLMCTDVLRQAVEAHDLLGFQFDLLWSPEDGGVEIDTSLSQFFGESGRRMNIAGKERRKAMIARLAARAKNRSRTTEC